MDLILIDKHVIKQATPREFYQIWNYLALQTGCPSRAYYPQNALI